MSDKVTQQLKELFEELQNSGDESIVQVKENDGLYDLVSVSTAAVEDREGETFTVKAIDYDIERALQTGVYPEYRVFHSWLPSQDWLEQRRN